MATFTPNVSLTLPAVGGDTNLWGPELNASISLLDTLLGGNATVSCAGGSNVTPSSAQSQNFIHTLTGALTANINYILPQQHRVYVINNQTTGAFTITVVTSASGTNGSVVVPQGSIAHIYSDATNIFPCNGTQSTPAQNIIGEGKDFWGAASAVPPGWVLAFGQTLLISSFPKAAAVFGTTYGGNGSTTFGIPDKRSRMSIPLDNMGGTAASRVTSAGSGINAVALGGNGGNQLLQSHSHTINIGDPGHNHSHNDPGHAHGVADPGHAHGYADPGHTHTVDVSTGNNFPFTGGGNNTAVIPVAGSAIGTFGAGVGISIGVSGTGIGIFAAATGVTNNASGTGISASSNGAGSGGSQNMPPGIVCNYIVFVGP